MLLADRVKPYRPPSSGDRFTAYLGIDIGSVSTNLVVVDEAGEVVFDSYLRTAGRPVEAVQQGLTELKAAWGDRIIVAGVGTTGSGRELVGEFVGADVVNDEITAHKTGAVHVSSARAGALVDTIFEIGGQDSKFISLENGVVVDFTMNEACAAGHRVVPRGAGRQARDRASRASSRGWRCRRPRPPSSASAARCSWSATSRAGSTRASRFRTWSRAWRTRSPSTT